MTEDYQLIDNLHEELERVHSGLEQYNGIQLENGYETGPFLPEIGMVEGYEHILEDKENFEDKGCLLRAAGSLEQMAEMIQKARGAEYVTLGRIPIEGPIGESMVGNVNLKYNFKIEDDHTDSYWELDSKRVDTEQENASEQIRGIESIVNEYTETNVEEMPVESESEMLKGMASRIVE